MQMDLWAFSTSIQLQKISKIEAGPFGDIKKFQIKSHKAEKGAGTVSQSRKRSRESLTKPKMTHEVSQSRKKFRTVPKKIERGDPLILSGFVGYVKKVRNEWGTLCTKFALARCSIVQM